jgi:hypothetical protein
VLCLLLGLWQRLLWLILLCLLRLRRLTDDWHFSSIRKCLDNIWQWVGIVIAGQFCRCPSRRCDTRLELLLLRSLRVTLSFRFVIKRWPRSDLRCSRRICRSPLGMSLRLTLVLYGHCRHWRSMFTIMLQVSASVSITQIRFMRTLSPPGDRATLLVLVTRPRRRCRLGGNPGQPSSWLVCRLRARRWQRRLVVIITLSGMCTFRIRHPFTLPLRSSPVGSMRRSFQHRSSGWQNRHVVLVQNFNTRIV